MKPNSVGIFAASFANNAIGCVLIVFAFVVVDGCARERVVAEKIGSEVRVRIVSTPDGSSDWRSTLVIESASDGICLVEILLYSGEEKAPYGFIDVYLLEDKRRVDLLYWTGSGEYAVRGIRFPRRHARLSDRDIGTDVTYFTSSQVPEAYAARIAEFEKWLAEHKRKLIGQ